MISFSLGWSDAAGGAFETIWFQHCFRRVSSRRAKPKSKSQFKSKSKSKPPEHPGF